MQEIVKAQKNVELFFAEEKDSSRSSRSDKQSLRTLPLIRQGSQGLFCLLLSLYLERLFRQFQFVWQPYFPIPRNRCTICNTIIPEVRNAFTLLNGQIAVDQKQSVGGYFQLFAQSSIFSIINASAGRFGFHPEEFSVDGKRNIQFMRAPADAASERITLEQSETSAPCSS